MSATGMKVAAGHHVRKGLSGSVVHEEKMWGPWLLFKKLNRKDNERGQKGERKGGKREGKLVVSRWHNSKIWLRLGDESMDGPLYYSLCFRYI